MMGNDGNEAGRQAMIITRSIHSNCLCGARQFRSHAPTPECGESSDPGFVVLKSKRRQPAVTFEERGEIACRLTKEQHEWLLRADEVLVSSDRRKIIFTMPGKQILEHLRPPS